VLVRFQPGPPPPISYWESPKFAVGLLWNLLAERRLTAKLTAKLVNAAKNGASANLHGSGPWGPGFKSRAQTKNRIQNRPFACAFRPIVSQLCHGFLGTSADELRLTEAQAASSELGRVRRQHKNPRYAAGRRCKYCASPRFRKSKARVRADPFARRMAVSSDG